MTVFVVKGRKNFGLHKDFQKISGADKNPIEKKRGLWYN